MIMESALFLSLQAGGGLKNPCPGNMRPAPGDEGDVGDPLH